MSYSRGILGIQREITPAWQGILASVKQMHPSSVIRPSNAADIFRPDSDSAQPKFYVGPMVFNVPERAKDNRSKLYIVVQGWIMFGEPLSGAVKGAALDGRRTTLRFGTQVGYFREKDNNLVHVYGVHYDMDEELPGHPVFHAQMCTQAELAPAVEKYFKFEFNPSNDLSRGLLRNVRTPTAQMDVFSVITQIGADHLLSEASNNEVREAFKRLRSACDFFLGAGGG